MTPPTPTAYLELSGGRWLRVHMATVNQQLELSDLQPAEDDNAGKVHFRSWLSMLDDACEEKSWEGSVGDGLAMHELEPLILRWIIATEENAFPFAQGSSSETPSAEQLSEEPTADPSQSSTRPSSQSSRRRARGASRPGK